MATRAQVVNLLKSQVGTYGPPNNRNKFNTWYYGHPVSGDDYAWCVVFKCWGMNQLDILVANGGKFAYVPDFKTHFQKVGAYVDNPSNTSKMEPGDHLALDTNGNGGPDHFATVVKVLSSSTVETIEGNTSGRGNDDVAIKTRHISMIKGHAKLMGVDDTPSNSNSDGDDMGEYVSVDKTDKSRHEVLEAGKWTQIYFDQNNSKASEKQHAKGDFPSLVQGHNYYNGSVSLVVTGLPEGTRGRIRCLYTDAKTGEVKATCDQAAFSSDDVTGTPVKFPVAGYVPTGQKLRVEVTHYGAPELRPTVVAGYVRLFVKEA